MTTYTDKSVKSKIVSFVVAAMLVIACGAFAAVSRGNTAEAKSSVLNCAETLSERYELGETLVLPEAAISYGGKEYAASAVTTYPSGTVTTSKTLLLSERGKYVVRFRAEADGREITEERTFEVREKLFAARKPTETRYATDENNELSEINTGASGRYVNLYRGATLKYNSVIDLKKLGGDDFISFNLLPALDGSRDASHIYVTLTDAFDERNYVTIRVCSSLKGKENTTEEAHANSWQVRYSYIAASANGSKYAGLEAGKNKVHYNNNFGSSATFSFYGYEKNMFYTDKNGERKPQFLALAYDPETKSVYQSSGIGRYIVSDLDDRDYNPDYVFGGFTTDEIFLSVTVDGLTNDSAKMLITDIAGQGTKDDYLDGDYRPVIEVNADGYAESDLPTAVPGVRYPLYAAIARDAYDGYPTVKTEVFYGYGTSSQYSVSIRDGAFVPDIPGVYTIRYSAENSFGNVGEKLLRVAAVSGNAAPVISDVKYDGTYYAGEPIAIVTPVYGGGSGNKSLAVRVVCGSEEIKITDGAFRPLKKGTYEAIYTVTDHLGQTAEKRASIEVRAKNVPVFIDEIDVPDYFIAGYKYTLPKIFAYDFSDGMKKAPTAIAVKGGEFDSETREFVPSENAEEARIYYAAAGVTKSVIVPIVNVKNSDGGLDLTKFFDLSGLTAQAFDEEIIFTAGGEKETSGYRFINPLVADGFSASFRFVSGKTRFSRLDLTLTDEADRRVSLDVAFTKRGGDVVMNAGGSVYTLAGALSGATITIGYNRADNTLTVNNSVTVALKDFGGFPSGRIMLGAKMSGVYGEAAFAVSNICGQKISNADDDIVRASFAPADTISLTASMGKTLTIPKGYSADVLYPLSECDVTVYLPDGTIATSTDGIRLYEVPADRNYEIAPNAYGTVQIRYRATADEDGLETRVIYYSIQLLDELPPEIMLDGKLSRSVKVGQAIKLPTVTAKDNVSENVTVSVLVRCPGTSKIVYIKGATFTPTEAGEYTVTFIAADEAGNTASLEYKVTAK